ncbi:MAG TPA: TIGR03013 family XrtA/PEP-CTERM system glycosyltransferase [Planctomycetota bacterium]|nr:TIGR03013 family XrtA/PEP-CTERM system glycosyltransferase [Planctomycetota bacterium]
MRVFQHYISARRLLMVLSETWLFFFVFAVGATIRVGPLAFDSQAAWHSRWSALLAAAICQVVLMFQDLYDWRISALPRERNPRIVAACGIAFVVLAAVFFYFQAATLGVAFGLPTEDLQTRTWRFIGTVIAAFTALAFWRSLFHAFFGRWRFAERVLILGGGELAASLAREIADHRDSGFEVAAMVSGPNEPLRRPRRRDPVVPYLRRDLGDLYDVARELRVHRVVVALQDRRATLPVDALLKCRLNGIRIDEREQVYERVTGKLAVEVMRPSYIIFSEGFRKAPLALAVKRALDVVLSATGLLVSLPITVAIAIAIRVDSPGSVFFRQPRVGKDGRAFVLFKFRSMRADAEKGTGPVWAQLHDDRVTRVGKFIRKTRIDEIPQMWNVLRGEMSFVGPRPERPFFVEELASEIPYYMERLTVKPGITGWAQICYPYGSSKGDAIQKLQYDLYYIKNLSLLFDLTILLRTVKVVLLREGAR